MEKKEFISSFEIFTSYTINSKKIEKMNYRSKNLFWIVVYAKVQSVNNKIHIFKKSNLWRLLSGLPIFFKFIPSVKSPKGHNVLKIAFILIHFFVFRFMF